MGARRVRRPTLKQRLVSALWYGGDALRVAVLLGHRTVRYRQRSLRSNLDLLKELPKRNRSREFMHIIVDDAERVCLKT
ncbi:protein of unknown function [Bradyrhizobium vignae]|uniref:Uncharacterized protein n=1 Tax=Bradyrhizobium vignae TaxID=1549949 RepID=A0A2U3PV65_9BRAD|nr:protein of unknown function [Bradyrhizobium vignae]